MRVPALVCINKADINPEISNEIEKDAQKQGITAAGRVRYDRAFTQAQIKKCSVVEFSAGKVSQDIKNLWRNVTHAF